MFRSLRSHKAKKGVSMASDKDNPRKRKILEPPNIRIGETVFGEDSDDDKWRESPEKPRKIQRGETVFSKGFDDDKRKARPLFSVNPLQLPFPDLSPPKTHSDSTLLNNSQSTSPEAAIGFQVAEVRDQGSVQKPVATVSRMKEAAIKVGLEMEPGRGVYVLKVAKVEASENEAERANQMAESAAILLLQSEMLREMADQLRAQYRASLQSMFKNSSALEF